MEMIIQKNIMENTQILLFYTIIHCVNQYFEILIINKTGIISTIEEDIKYSPSSSALYRLLIYSPTFHKLT